MSGAAREGAEPADAAASPDDRAAEPQHLRVGMLKHPRIRRVLVVLAMSQLAGLGIWWLRFRPFVPTDDARVAAPMVVVAAQGSGGRVARVLVREGRQVEAGQPVVELDSAAERAQLERARALVTLAEARIGAAEAQLALERRLTDATERRTRAGVRSAQAAHKRTMRGARAEELAQVQAELAAAQALAAQARRDLDRTEALARTGAMPARDLEAARAAEATARASLAGRQAALELLEHGARPEDVSISMAALLQAEAGLVEADAGSDRVALRTRQVEETRAQAAQARAELELAEIALSRRTLESSVGGVVVRVSVDPGDTLSAGQGAVAVVDIAHAWIDANIEETETRPLRPGQPVRITVDEGGELTGHVDVVTQSAASQFALIPADNATGNFTKVVQRIPTRIALDDPSRASALRIGQSVEVRIRVR